MKKKTRTQRTGPLPKMNGRATNESRRTKKRVATKRIKHPPATTDPPPDLDDIARAKWVELAEGLHAQGLLSAVDRDALASYCKACSLEKRATALLQEEGLVFTTQSGFKTAHPAVKIIREATTTMAKYQLEFGLTPAARSRVQIIETDDTEPDDIKFIFGD